MYVAAISTKTSSHYEDLRAVFGDLVKSKTPFTVHMSIGGNTTFPIPFMEGKASNGNVEQCVRNVLKQTFGTVEFHYHSESAA